MEPAGNVQCAMTAVCESPSPVPEMPSMPDLPPNVPEIPVDPTDPGGDPEPMDAAA
jgi:hypothetical protein